MSVYWLECSFIRGVSYCLFLVGCRWFCNDREKRWCTSCILRRKCPPVREGLQIQALCIALPFPTGGVHRWWTSSPNLLYSILLLWSSYKVYHPHPIPLPSRERGKGLLYWVLLRGSYCKRWTMDHKLWTKNHPLISNYELLPIDFRRGLQNFKPLLIQMLAKIDKRWAVKSDGFEEG